MEKTIKELCLTTGFDYYVVLHNGKEITVKESDIKQKKHLIIGKFALTYRAGQLDCIYQEYDVPFYIYQNIKFRDACTGKMCEYRLLKDEEGNFKFNKPDNKILFRTLKEAKDCLERNKGHEQYVRDYYLGL